MRYIELKSFIFPFAPATVTFLEKWLSRKAIDGWQLIRICGWKFVFQKCEPYSARYFYYSSFGTSRGIANDYLMSRARYSLKKAPINKLSTKIYEVDVKKVDSDFNFYILQRNMYYLKHYLAFLLFSLVYFIIAFSFLFLSLSFVCFFIATAIAFIYSLLSVLILIFTIKKQRQGTVRNH